MLNAKGRDSLRSSGWSIGGVKAGLGYDEELVSRRAVTVLRKFHIAAENNVARLRSENVLFTIAACGQKV